jgi:hypothetical protein
MAVWPQRKTTKLVMQAPVSGAPKKLNQDIQGKDGVGRTAREGLSASMHI